MKVAICFCFLIAAASGQFLFPSFGFPGFFPYPYGFPSSDFSDQYAASLGGAQVGLYSKSHGFPGYGFSGFGGFPGFGSSEVTGASLGGAPVGIYGKENVGYGK